MAYELYKNYAAITKDVEMARVFLQLADQEKGHARIIAHYF
jgi:rubrerythrin